MVKVKNSTDSKADPALRERYSDFCQMIESHYSERSVALIDEALNLAEQKLRGMERYDGSPFLEHSVNTAKIVISEIGLGRNSTISTLMHDVARLELMTPKEIGLQFGKACEGILEGMNDISEVETKESKEQAANFRDLIVSYSSDPRVILIKLADRLEVMRELTTFPDDKQLKKSWESLNLYAQIAHRLGLYNIKSEMEDISLSFLKPDDHAHILQKLEETSAEREKFIAKFLIPIEKKLKEVGIKYSIKGRTKSIYSIWSKMRRMSVPFEEIYDIFALRIIVDCEPEEEKTICWSVYSIVTDFYTPNTDRLRDWISIPKSNGYESLHTTVVDENGRWVEIQIRSERMDEVAERGIAAHWRYKGVKQGGMSSEQWLNRLREMMEGDPQAISKEFKDDEGLDEVFVFTPKGDLRKLPEGSTLLDFAFDIHTDVGKRCIGGRINQRNVPLREKLKNGDIVEINTSNNQTPKADWLSFAKTNKARNRIRAFIRAQEAEEARYGREELERRIRNWKLGLTIDEAVNALTKYYKAKSGTELYGKIAENEISMADVKDVLTQFVDGELFEPKKPRVGAVKSSVEEYSDDVLVIDEDIKSLDYKFAKCCNPIFGDKVFGFVTVNNGITVHRVNCPNAARLKEDYPYRVLSAEWRKSKSESGAFQASIRVVARNTTGIVNRITDIITNDLSINIRSMNMSPNNRGELSGLINIEVTGTSIVDLAIHSISRLKEVQRAYRVN